ncbi:MULTISPECIES: DUF2513 domain-containing protein [unclassified Mesorhizobium]|uniref:DUF2513 domain-containing protein n=1 Tax=unclassified Mesorhizobium TaxID=325217 RepID=UPI0016765074|nr:MULTISPECIES: DUF2513 domain-containing protein [unclassified Mesorhizobium]
MTDADPGPHCRAGRHTGPSLVATMIPRNRQVIVALDPKGRAVVKRDMELIREILLAVQNRTDLTPRPLTLEGHDEVVVGRHIEMLSEAGLIDGPLSTRVSQPYDVVLIKDLSWEGHDFIAALVNKGVWSKIKQSYSAAELAGLPLSVLKEVGIGLLKEWAKSKVGLGAGTIGSITSTP